MSGSPGVLVALNVLCVCQLRPCLEWVFARQAASFLSESGAQVWRCCLGHAVLHVCVCIRPKLWDMLRYVCVCALAQNCVSQCEWRRLAVQKIFGQTAMSNCTKSLFIYLFVFFFNF